MEKWITNIALTKDGNEKQSRNEALEDAEEIICKWCKLKGYTYEIIEDYKMENKKDPTKTVEHGRCVIITADYQKKYIYRLRVTRYEKYIEEPVTEHFINFAGHEDEKTWNKKVLTGEWYYKPYLKRISINDNREWRYRYYNKIKEVKKWD